MPALSQFPRSLACLTFALAATLSIAAGAQGVKVGLALDLSGPFAALGADSKTGFAVAMKQLGGKLGGVPVTYVEADTGGNPDSARQAVDRMVQRDKIDLFTGPIGSQVALAVGPVLFAARCRTCRTTQARARTPARSAMRTSSAPRTRTTRTTSRPASSPPTRASRRPS